MEIGLSRINILAYAEDIILLASSKHSLKKIFIKFKKILDKLELIINVKKSKILIFTKEKCILNKTFIDIESSSFEVVNNFNFLGHILYFNLNDDKDILNKLNKFYISFNCMYRNFSKVNIETMLYLFNSYCSSMYGAQLWSSLSI